MIIKKKEATMLINLKKDSRVHLLDERLQTLRVMLLFLEDSHVRVKHLEHSWHCALSIMTSSPSMIS